MKKIIISTIVVVGLTLSGYAQGTIYFDGSANNAPSSSATSEGQVFIGGVLDTATDVNAVLLMFNGSMYVPVVTLLLSDGSSATTTVAFGSTQGAVGDITSFNGGGPFDSSGNGYQESFVGLGSGTTGTFEVEAWTGSASTYAAAVTAQVNGTYGGITAPFTEVLTSPTGTANDIEGMPALNMIALGSAPEPSTIALAGLGGLASLVVMRRRKIA
jgi:hypothetical protein